MNINSQVDLAVSVYLSDGTSVCLTTRQFVLESIQIDCKYVDLRMKNLLLLSNKFQKRILGGF